jgi:quercetin dioxygenase-like cupin family protein
MVKDKATVYILQDVEQREMMPGGQARMYHTNHMSLAVWDFIPGADLPSHSHPHEQITSMIEGQFEMTLDGKVFILEPGMVVTIPPHVVHSGKALTACHIVDVFYPVREDFRSK